jgi:hypothetical protein
MRTEEMRAFLDRALSCMPFVSDSRGAHALAKFRLQDFAR